MLVPYNTLPKNAKVWVYQSDKIFLDNQIPIIEDLTEKFLNQWQRHGNDLRAAYKIVHNQFIVLAVNDEVSGCSIDTSVHLMQDLEQRFNIDLTDKLQVAFKDGDNINTVSLADFKKYIALNKITEETIVFNNMVDSVASFQNEWEVPAANSWHNKYFN